MGVKSDFQLCAEILCRPREEGFRQDIIFAVPRQRHVELGRGRLDILDLPGLHRRRAVRRQIVAKGDRIIAIDAAFGDDSDPGPLSR